MLASNVLNKLSNAQYCCHVFVLKYLFRFLVTRV